ncbi:MFS transporter [Bifidobacterium oedipodis]|uniref:Methylenomycin A resistance protein (MMR peptide) n=1 Tax=Bifidobacterium oedipodis TaxID=2675322 RepID=A0A7Y0EMY4_9BIFI|nr:MFS transporter [Bifidobacterium sp. DSM 109957]NMM93192.1 Methylenomycin A resistance protein (MMR peptide) [Bifidobacterium sp. DSM 109957]
MPVVDSTRQHPTSRIPVVAASTAFFLSCMDVLIVNLALPTIGEQLGGGMSGQQWVVDGYTLPFAALLLGAGNLSDRLGAKRVFAAGSALFLISSLICTFAFTMPMLIAGRAIMGVGAAALLPSSMSVIRENYPDPVEQGQAMGYWAFGGTIAAVMGPILGGLLTPIHWSLVFAINIPACLLILVLIPKMQTSERRSAPFDFAGQILAIVGLGALVAGLIEGGEQGFASVLVVSLLAIGVAALAMFAVAECHARHPMMPPSTLRSYDMRVSMLIGLVFMVAWYGMVFLTTSLLQNELGLSPFMSGLAFIPSAFAGMIGNLRSPGIATAHGTRVPVVGGLIAMTAGLTTMALLGSHLNAWSAAILVAVVGCGCSFVTPPTSSLVLRSVAPEQSGIAGAMFNTMRQVGSTLGIAVFGTLVASMSSFTSAMRICFLATAALLLITLGLSIRLEHNPSNITANRRIADHVAVD